MCICAPLGTPFCEQLKSFMRYLLLNARFLGDSKLMKADGMWTFRNRKVWECVHQHQDLYVRW